MTRPLCIDLFCGLGGWTEGFLAEGYDVIGFDVERHVYGEHRYPAQLVLQDVRTLHGSQFKDAAIIVASSPCQEFSYRAMPWKRAKALGPPELGMELFAQAGRIQREASESAGRHIPMVQENVRGAQKYVGRAAWHYGSFYLWGDVPALMPVPFRAPSLPGMNWSGSDKPGYKAVAFNDPRHGDGTKVGGRSIVDANGNKRIAEHWRSKAEQTADGMKNGGGSWFNIGSPGQKVVNRVPVHDATKQGGDWFRDMTGDSGHGSKSSARKAASARIAKIPLPLAQWIAHTYRPAQECVA